MSDFTVILMRSYRFSDLPEWDNEPETDCYVAFVEADDRVQAVMEARKQALAADQRTLGKVFMRRMELDLDSYTFLVLFEGHQDAKLFGSQTGPWSDLTRHDHQT